MITIHSSFGSDTDLQKKSHFDLIKQAGFDGVLMWWGNCFGDDNFRDNPALARSSGLFVENIHAPYDYINNLWLDNVKGVALLDKFLVWVDDCVSYDIPTLVFHLSAGDDPPPFNETGLDRVKRIVEKAEKRGVNIAFENLRRVEYLEYVLSQVDSPYAGFCYDSGHQNFRSPDVDLLAMYGSRLKALHLHDNDGTDDQHLLPFDGVIDWQKTMADIVSAGYTGAVALEVGTSEHESCDFYHLAYERGLRLKALMMKKVHIGGLMGC